MDADWMGKVNKSENPTLGFPFGFAIFILIFKSFCFFPFPPPLLSPHLSTSTLGQNKKGNEIENIIISQD